MARVDYDPVPDVSARVQAPDDYQHVQASPDAFGAEVAQGLGQVGQGAIVASDFYGKVAADEGYNNLLQQGTQILYGTGQPVQGADGSVAPDAGYFGKRGADAMSAREDTAQALDDAIRKNGDSLKTPLARHQYETDSRRLRSQWTAEIGRHADNEQKVWAKDTNDTAATLALNDLGRAPLDPETVASATDRLKQSMVRNAQLAGLDTNGAILKSHQDAALARVRSLIVSDPKSAQKVFDESRAILGSLPNYDQVARQVKEADINAEFAPAVDGFMAGVTTDAARSVGIGGDGPDLSAVQRAFRRQESGDRSNIPNSIDGAVGPGQVMPNTWAQWARPGEDIRNPDDNRRVSDRIIAHYYQEFHGDLARTATAYFSGPGNVAPPGSPTAWKHDYQDGNGAHVSAYVANLESRLAKYPTSADALNGTMNASLDDAQKFAEQKWPNYPDVQDRFVEHVRRRIDQAVSQQHQQYEIDTHIVQQVLTGPHAPISEDALIAMSPEVAKAWQSMQLNNPSAALSVERMFDANARGRAAGYGSEFKGYLDRVLAPQTDPGRLANPSQLYPFVGPGENAPLTNSGVGQLSELQKLRGTPHGEAQASQIKSFIDQMHGQLTFSNKGTGVYDANGEKRFNQFMSAALPVILEGAKNNTLGNLVNPQSKDYLGNAAQPFMRNSAQIQKDQLASMQGATPLAAYTPQTLNRTLDELDNDAQRQAALKAAVQQHRITVAHATEIGIARGYIRGPASRPAPGGFPTRAPPPIPNETVH